MKCYLKKGQNLSAVLLIGRAVGIGFFAFCAFYLAKFGMGLQSKLVKSSISLLKVCIALGSEEFLGGEKVCSKGRV